MKYGYCMRMVFFIFFLSSCAPLYAVFEQDDPRLIMKVDRLYRLPLPADGGSYLLIQGVGGKLSHTGDQTWAFDWAMPEGTPVCAARAGVVETVLMERESATVPLESRVAGEVRIRNADDTLGVYAHIRSARVEKGRRVAAGDIIAESGNTGFSTRPHLHFHVEKDGRSIPVGFSDVDDEEGTPRSGRDYAARY